MLAAFRLVATTFAVVVTLATVRPLAPAHSPVEPEPESVAIQQMVDAQVARLSGGLSCVDPSALPASTIPARVLVRNAPVTRAGVRQFDTRVVRAVSFDRAWELARRGDVIVVAACVRRPV